MSRRAGISSPWQAAQNLGSPINSSREDVSPHFAADGLSLLFASDRSGGYGNYDLYICTRPSVEASWSAPTNLSPVVNSPYLDVAPTLSSDGLVLFFHSTRAGGFGNYDLYVTRRDSLQDEWLPPVNLGSPVNSSYSELGPSISSDGRHLYFSDHYVNPPRPGGLGTDDIWEVSIRPIVDLNNDEIVDWLDYCQFASCWDSAEPCADVYPAPLGDGVVGVEDLIVLMEHWLERIPAIGLVAHWKLDETGGYIAHDSAGSNDAFVMAMVPGWAPQDGQVDGALNLNGTSDHILTNFVLNPGQGSFSVFCWVKGGAPGQVVLSQAGGADWLKAHPSEGALMTELQGADRNDGPLVSQAGFTDGDWHRIGLVRDDQLRSLYVDDVLVAEDTQSGFLNATGGLNIGCGSTPTAETFWSGMMDDVRIYDRAIHP